MLDSSLKNVLRVMSIYTSDERKKITHYFNKNIVEKFTAISDGKITMSPSDYLKLLKLNKHVLHYKYLYSIPRPFLRSHIIKNNYVAVVPNDSPSYPSGHAAGYHLLYLIFSNKDPINEPKYRKLSLQGMLSRIIGGVHTFEDINGGIMLADNIYNR